MPATFSFDVDNGRRLVRITMAGFFETDDITRFAAARADAHHLLTCGPNQHLTLLDIQAMQIQSQAAVAIFRELLHDPRYTSRRLAIIVSQSLARMQIERVATGREVGYFADMAAGKNWLLIATANAAKLPASPY